MIRSIVYKLIYIILIILSLTILNWLWYAPSGDGEKRYLYDISQLENKSLDDKIIYFIIWLILIITILLFYIYDDFRYYDIIIGYILWKMIPFVSIPINIP